MNVNEKIKDIINNFDGQASVFAVDEYGNEIKFNENKVVESASCIKVFILIEYYRQIMMKMKSREDKLKYNTKNDYIARGSGIIKYLQNDFEISSKNMATFMIIVSDNIATNKMIEYLGFENINNTIKSLGFNNTSLIAKRLDFDVYNSIGKTTAYEFASVFRKILKKEILSPNLCDEIIAILSCQTKNEMLIKDLPKKYLYEKGNKEAYIRYIASKSGGLGSDNKNIITCRNDGGIVCTKLGTYIISIFINNFADFYFYSDNPATILGAKISSLLFENFEENDGKFKF